MKKENKKKLCAGFCLLLAFALWTAAVCFVDVRPIGPRGSSVGFAGINEFFHSLTGVNMDLYVITDWLSLIPIGFMLGFGLLGLAQWITRKSIARVDFSILALGGFYVVVAASFVLFEVLTVNYRPVLIDGVLEASYPSSTTLLVLCVMPTAILQLRGRITNRVLRYCVSAVLAAFAAFMIVGRLASGVHWLSDIIGGGLLSAGLVMLYDAVCSLECSE